tara:strand:+ start:117 stop:341 length:225 start_codon:yes stop_codon:yes gene_type:complete
LSCYGCGYGQLDRRWQAFAREVMVAKSPAAAALAQASLLAAHKAGTGVGCGLCWRGDRDWVLRNGFFGFWLLTL